MHCPSASSFIQFTVFVLIFLIFKNVTKYTNRPNVDNLRGGLHICGESVINSVNVPGWPIGLQ